jgi:hypothetical protein
MWEAESRQAAAWNEYLRSQDLYNQASSMNLTLKVNNDKGIQISGSQESLDSLLEEHVEFTPPLTFELIDNVNALSPPSTPRQKPLEKIAASWIGAIATALILGNLINLAATFSVQAATVTAAASSAAWAVPLGASLIILFMFTMRQNIIKNTPLPALLSDLIRIGFASPNPTFDKLVSEYAKSGKLTPATRLGIFGLLAPPLDPNLDPVILNEVNSAYARAREGMMEGHNFILPDRSSFLDLVGVGVGTDGAPPPVITFDWDSLKQGKTTTLLDGIAQAKPVGSILAFVATGKGQTTAEMANYVETRWPGLDKSYRVVYVDSDQISKNNLGEVNKVHSEKLANYISRQILNGSQISLRVLVSSEHRNRWVGLALDIIPIDAGYSVQGLLGAFRNTHLIFNIQA